MSEAVDVAVPVSQARAVCHALASVKGLRRSEEEPSVFVAEDPTLIEVNFIGMAPELTDPAES